MIYAHVTNAQGKVKCGWLKHQLTRLKKYELSDNKTVSESGLRNGGKVFLVVKKEDGVRPTFWDELYAVLKKHFKEPECTMVLEQMKKVHIIAVHVALFIYSLI